MAGLGRHLVKNCLGLSMNANPNSSFRSLPRPCRLLASCWPDSLLHANQVEGHRPLARIHRDVQVAGGGLRAKAPTHAVGKSAETSGNPYNSNFSQGEAENSQRFLVAPGAISAAPPALSAACGPAGVRQMTSLEQ